MNENQRFRALVLKVHYELAAGDMFKPVLRPDVAAKLDMPDYNDMRLLNAVMYLVQKGYLGNSTNVTENLTVRGVDEYENGFPNLGSPGGGAPESIDLLVNLSEKINNAEDLATKGLYKEQELAQLTTEVEGALLDLIPQDTMLWREFDREKRTTRWRQVRAGTPYISDIGTLALWRTYIEKLVKELGGEIPKEQVIIQKGETFLARKTLRAVLAEARESIKIVDNYASDIEVLKILEPYKRNNPKLEIMVLTGSTGSDFISDLEAFKKEHGEAEFKKSKKDTSHDRYLILDGTEVYHFGASLKDLGKAGSRISKMNPGESKKIIESFLGWWDESKELS